MSEMEKPLIIVCGEVSVGKSACFRNIPNQERWVFGNTEAGKPIPFRNKFNKRNIVDTAIVAPMINAANASPNIDGVIVDSLTFLLDNVNLELNLDEDVVGFEKWNQYDNFIKKFFLKDIGALTKPLIMTAHVKDVIVEGSGKLISIIPVKGQNKAVGLEGYATLIVHAKKVPIEKLKEYDKDRRRGYKHVFQTRSTEDNMHERMRAPLDFFDDMSEVFIDNDIMHIINRWNEYYGTDFCK